MSALPIQNSLMLRKWMIRECSKKRPRIERTTDVFGKSLGHRAQRADPAHHDLDPNPGLRRPIERVDHLLVDQCVHLETDSAVPAFAVRGDLAFDAFDDAGANSVRRHQQIAIGDLTRVSG